MQCLKAQRTLRKNAQTSGASDCWRNLSIVSRENARACGFLHEVVLCKKDYDVQTNFNKSNCSHPFRSGACKGTLVKCPTGCFQLLIFLKATLELSSASRRWTRGFVSRGDASLPKRYEKWNKTKGC